MSARSLGNGVWQVGGAGVVGAGGQGGGQQRVARCSVWSVVPVFEPVPGCCEGQCLCRCSCRHECWCVFGCGFRYPSGCCY